jgi:hypothetical protein
MSAKFNSCIAIGGSNKEKTADDFCDLFNGRISAEKDNWIEVTAGPFRFYFVEDGTQDIAFSVDVDDEEACLRQILTRGYQVDRAISDRIGETFVRSPEGLLINLYPVKKLK